MDKFSEWRFDRWSLKKDSTLLGYLYPRKTSFPWLICQFTPLPGFTPWSHLFQIHQLARKEGFEARQYAYQAIEEQNFRLVDPEPHDAEGSDLYINGNEAGFRLFVHGRGSLALLDQAIQHDPDNPNLYYARYQVVSGFEGKLWNLNEAIRLDPHNADYFESRAEIYENEGNDTQAIVNYTQAIALNRKTSENYRGRGRLYRHQENWEAALTDFTEALRLELRSASVLYAERASTYFKQGDLESALTEYTHVIACETDRYSYVERGMLYFIKNDYQAAIADFTAAINLHDASWSVRRDRGIAWAALGQITNALTDFHWALDHLPDKRRDKSNEKSVQHMLDYIAQHETRRT